MKLNVSAVKTYLTCPQLWYYQYVMNRVVDLEPVALTSGKLWHKFIERISNGEHVVPVLTDLSKQASNAVADLTVAGKKSMADSLRLTWECMHQAGTEYRDEYKGETVAAEQPLSMTIGVLPSGEAVELIGIPDRIRRINSQLLHSQSRTLSASTPLVPYLEAAARDLHELAYALLISSAYPDEQYFGTEMSILVKAKMYSNRKCSKAGTKWHQDQTRPSCDECGYVGRVTEQLRTADEIMVHKLIPIDPEQVKRAISDIMQVALAMDTILKGGQPVQNRGADLGRFGNSLCSYFGVCAGTEDLDDDTLFTTRESRYALPAEAEEVSESTE